jgi:hypothetical protein
MICNYDDDTMTCNDDDVIIISCLHTKLNLKRNRCASPPMSEDRSAQVCSGARMQGIVAREQI